MRKISEQYRTENIAIGMLAPTFNFFVASQDRNPKSVRRLPFTVSVAPLGPFVSYLSLVVKEENSFHICSLAALAALYVPS